MGVYVSHRTSNSHSQCAHVTEAPFVIINVVILEFQSRDVDPWYKCLMVGFVRSGHNLGQILT